MPKVNFKHVVSFSTEDVKNPAENLLKPESYFKWKTGGKGESQAIVVLQLEKATQIHSVDIGNNGSAFVEVLTGRSTWDATEEYQVLLVASSFMTPAESKSGTNQMRVRMFGAENLNKTVANQKWDRIKVVCTQPYNKDEAYGLSFVQLHSPPEEEPKTNKAKDSAETENFKTKIGLFTLREEADKDDISIGSYFSKKSQNNPMKTTSLAASARDATSSILSSALSSPASSESKKTQHLSTFTPKRDYVATPKREKTGQSEEKLGSKGENTSTKQLLPNKTAKRKASEDQTVRPKEVAAKKVDNSAAVESPMPPSKKVKPSSRPRRNPQRPFHKLMRKVVFALSGYQNPTRGNIRDKALSMGAEYRPGWGPGCTHLICAFRNTPKFNQVKGHGIIVSDKWILDCAKRKERLSIKPYRMDGGSSSSDCDSDVQAEELKENTISSDKDRLEKPAPDERNKGEVETATASKVNAGATASKIDVGPSATTSEIEVGPTATTSQIDQDIVQPEVSTNDQYSDSTECDTEDELKKARLAIDTNAAEDDSYGGSTEDESDKEADKSTKLNDKPEQSEPVLPQLPDYFEGKHFLLYGTFDERDRRLLSRYITAYNGVIEDYMSDKVNFVVSNDDWDDNFEQASTTNPSLSFVRPKWIFKCHELRKLVSYNNYIIPKD